MRWGAEEYDAECYRSSIPVMSVRQCAVGPSKMPAEEPGVEPAIGGHLVVPARERVQHFIFRGESVEQFETEFAWDFLVVQREQELDRDGYPLRCLEQGDRKS